MSLQAMAEVIGRHQNGYADGSPRSGALFVVELMIADAVNEQNQNVFWMSNESLAKKARLARQTVNRCVKELEDAGVLRRLGYHESGAIRFQWLGPRGVTSGDTPCHPGRQPLSREATPPVADGDTNPREPKRTQAAVDFDKQLEHVRAVKANHKR